MVAFFLFLLSVCFFVISYFQFKEKGTLFNNAYLYASAEERNKMDKHPYYRQSGIVFLFIGIIFLINTIEVLLEKNWLFYMVLVISLITIVYAIVSSILIETKK